jgi:starch synthase (maltosyl-transferring)
VAIEAVRPEVDGGRYPIKRVVGEPVRVDALLVADGHDRVTGVLRYRAAGEPWREAPLRPLGGDRFGAEFAPTSLGTWEYALEAWVDAFATWRAALAAKAAAGQDVEPELLEGAAHVREAGTRATDAEDAAWLAARAELLAGPAPDAARVEAALDAELARRMALHPDRRAAAHGDRVLEVQVERELARAGAWYEFFPRSSAREPGCHGTFRDAERMLEYAAAMRFDVVYLPPIHPIGRTHRKGAGNAPTAGPDDPGSPWAIGAAEGGHTAVHPQLGTLADFERFVARARALGLEVALDLAFQCSPDHPWVAKHPEWFRHRPDGSIQYAENPPKKYQDVYPLDFESPDWRALWEELKGVVLFWIGHGVTVFRVDNPHTKPFAFWEWLIREVRLAHPEAIFLAEAFTRPAVMARLAKLGFSQSYTYFTWRNTRHEIAEYLAELGSPPVRDFMRGNFFTNTPDILPVFLQSGRRAAFQTRAVLAATLAGSWGIYGPPFELCEHRAVPDTEEYLDSEKYQLRHWDLDRPGHVRDWIARLNEIRRGSPALLRGVGPRFCPADNESLLAYARWTEDLADLVVVVANLDPYHTQSGWIDLPIDAWGIEPREPFQADDLLGGARYLWHGRRNYVQLDPESAPAHVLRVRRRVRTERDFDYYL